MVTPLETHTDDDEGGDTSEEPTKVEERSGYDNSDTFVRTDAKEGARNTCKR